MSSASSPKPFKRKERFWKRTPLGASILALNEIGNYREHFAFLGLGVATSKQEIK